MSLKLWHSTAGPRYSCYNAAETQEEADRLAKRATGVNYLEFKSIEITLPGYVLTIRGENEVEQPSEGDCDGDNSAGTDDAEQKPAETGGATAPRPANPAPKPPVKHRGAKKATGGGQKQGRQRK